MATLGRWTGAAISLFPSTAYTVPNGMFPTQQRNDGSAYSFDSATSTLTLPASGLADGYLIIARVDMDCTHNNRATIVGRITQASGTGNFTSTPSSGYQRNNANRRASCHTWAFVDSPSASATFQFDWKRDNGTGSPAGSVIKSSIEVIPLYYSDVGIYEDSTNNDYDGTTALTVSLTSTVLEGTNITRSSNTVTVTGDNKRYMVLSGYYSENRAGRTQRWLAHNYDSTIARDAMGCIYIRDGNNDEMGINLIDIMETSTADRTIELNLWRGDGVANNQGGADQDGNTPVNTSVSLVVIELNDNAEVFRSADDTGAQVISGTSIVDLNAARDNKFNDATSFTNASTTAYNTEQDMDALVGANVSAAYNNVSSGTRLTREGRLTVNGTEVTDVFDINYGRGNQGSADTFGFSLNLSGYLELTTGDDIGVSSQDRGNDGPSQTQPGWVGMWGINLDTLEATGGGVNTLKMGASDVTNLYIGGSTVTRAYFGSTEVYNP